MNKFGFGQPVRRVEDPRFLTGRGSFVDDIVLPHQCYGVAVMSPHPHARIVNVDATAALAAPGVECVLTGADAIADQLGGFPPLFMPDFYGGPKGYRTLRPVLVADRARFVGDRVAFVVARTPAQARDAAELVHVDYEPLPAVVNVENAVEDGAPRLYDDCERNVSFTLKIGNKDATDAAFAAARHVVSLRLVNNRLVANSIESRGAIGDYSRADDCFTLYSSSQNPHGLRQMLAQHIFRLPDNKFRVISPDVGGGFGLKTVACPEDALVLWASRRCGYPVKWIATRSENLMGDSHGRDQVVTGEMALDEHGRILAIRAQALHAVGAYIFAAAVAPIEFSLKLLPSVYDMSACYGESSAVFTNTSTLTSYRGAGRPEAIYLTERLLDRAAQVLGIDPIELRRRNVIRPEAMPHTTPTGYVYDSGDFARLMDQCLEQADWQGFAARRAASEKNGRLRGRALACYIEVGGRFNDRMELRFDPSGTVTILAGTHSHGQGHATTYAQMVSDWLGLPFEAIRFVQGDTGLVSFGRGTFAARSSLVGGCALRLAAERIIADAKPMAAHLLESSASDLQFKDGQFTIAGTDRSISITEVAKAFYRPVGLPAEFGIGLEAAGNYTASPPNYPNGCHACEVEVDPSTGAVTVDRYTVVDDVGRVINPLLCEGQIHGGVAQGIGQALMEAVIYDRETGQLLSGSFVDYAMPRADDLPSLGTSFLEVPCKTNPLGIKGAGEAGAVGSPPAVINALLDALRPLGVDHIDMPATPSRVWECIQRAANVNRR